ncbi:hypothetical protein V6N13_005197 [Hibiscus sabdariffa]
MICKECGKNIESSLWSLVLSFRQREGLWGYTKQSAFTLSEKSVSLAEEEVNNDDDALKGVLVLQTTILSIELKDLEVGFDFVPMTDSRFRSKGSKGFASGQALNKPASLLITQPQPFFATPQGFNCPVSILESPGFSVFSPGAQHDAWLVDPDPLVNWVVDPTLLVHNQSTPIASLVDGDGCWKWEELEEVLPETILQHLLATKLSLGDSGSDMPGWKWSENRHFSVRSTYAIGTEQSMASFVSFFYPNCSEGRSILDLSRMVRDDMVCGAATRMSQAPRAVVSSQLAHWQSPPSDWLKLNCDGSHNPQNESSACGGVLHDAMTRRCLFALLDANAIEWLMVWLDMLTLLFNSRFYQTPPDFILQLLHDDCTAQVS